MSTMKPRITVTLEPRAHEVLSRLSAASGDSMSKIVAGFVDLAVPSLERVVVVLERAKGAPQEVRAGLSAAIARAERDLIPAALEVLGQNDLFLADALAATAEPEGRAEPGAPAPRGQGNPRPVTRGSGRGGRQGTGQAEGAAVTRFPLPPAKAGPGTPGWVRPGDKPPKKGARRG